MYIITIEAFRKNAKRHIFHKFDTIQDADAFVVRYLKDAKYKYSLYTGNWELIKVY